MPKLSTSENIDSIRLSEQTTAPDTPSSGHQQLYTKSDGLYLKRDDGTEHGPLAELAGSGVVQLEDGGTESDLSATGPGVVVQSAAGNALSVESALDESRGGTGRGSYSTGDILVADGTSSLTVVSVGNDDYVLTADSSEPSGVKWAAGGGGGGVEMQKDDAQIVATAETINYAGFQRIVDEGGNKGTVQAPSPRNLVLNGGFEEPGPPSGTLAFAVANIPAGWSAEGTAGTDYTAVPSTDTSSDAGCAVPGGTPYSCKIVTAAADKGIQQTIGNLKGSTSYLVVWRYKVNTSGTDTAKVVTTGAGTNISWSNATDTSWARASSVFVTDSSGTDVVLKLIGGFTNSDADTVWFDDVAVFEISSEFCVPAWGDALLTAYQYQYDNNGATTKYEYTRWRIEVGKIANYNGAVTNDVTVTFQKAFSRVLSVVLEGTASGGNYMHAGFSGGGVTNTGFTCRVSWLNWGSIQPVYWIAVGVD